MVKPGSIVLKGDVVWAPYRREPLWPALVRNSYPKKVTYVFFPLPSSEVSEALKKAPTFSCLPKHVRALTIDDVLPSTSKNDLKNAFRLAKQYLKSKDLTRGSAAPLYFPKSTPKKSKPKDSKVSAESKELALEESTSLETIRKSLLQEELSEVDVNLQTTLAQEDTEIKTLQTKHEEKTESKKKEEIADKPSSKEVAVEAPSSKAPVKRKAPATTDCLNLAKRQPVSKSPPRPSAFAADSTTHSDTSPSPDLLAPTIFREAVSILERVWTTSLVQSYVTPPRSSLRFEMHNGGLLSDHETDSLFDLIFTWVRDREHDAYFLPGVHLVFEVLMPEVIIQSLVMSRGISRDVAERMVRVTHSESITSSSSSTSEVNCNHSPSTILNNSFPKCGGSLDELARIACKERESITE
ncbi:unnamed protein product [Cylicocyclus nassatus]|uniref:PWWP domain-containing protein n=1 Tax=Cylicocyclus nassatus TaxID=53992 RepID=A0AA36GKI9_CYLNA|nr:unnamed protein product [Cylicocyclus nassatus]